MTTTAPEAPQRVQRGSDVPTGMEQPSSWSPWTTANASGTAVRRVAKARTCSRCWVKHQMILIIQRTGRTGRTGVVKSVPQNSTKSSLSTSEASRAKNTLISRCPRSRKNLNVMLGMPFLWAIQTANSCSFQNSSCQGETYAEDAEGGKDGWIVGPYRATRSP